MKCQLLLIFTLATTCVGAQDKSLSYGASLISELQYNLSNKDQDVPKWANLLALDAELKTDRWWKNGMFKASFWSIRNSFDRPIAKDHLIFSNIDAKSHLLLCSALGYEHRFGRFMVFGGIRDVNIDYFTTPCDLFFTNSSAGITPTISLNYKAAVYPMAAMGIHMEYSSDNFVFMNSFYNNLKGVNEDNIFQFGFNPVKNGYVNFSQVQYSANSGIYYLGWVMEKTPERNFRYSTYISAEKNIARFSGSVLRAASKIGYTPQKDHYCRTYLGSGVILSNLLEDNEKDRLGLMLVYADLADDDELAAELTYVIELFPSVYLQPALHFIKHTKMNELLGLLRVTVNLNH